MSVLFSGNGHPLLCHAHDFCLFFVWYGNVVPSLAVDTWISSEFGWRHKQCLQLETFFNLPGSWENVLNQQYTQVCYVTVTVLETSGTKTMKKLKHLLWDMMIVLWRVTGRAEPTECKPTLSWSTQHCLKMEEQWATNHCQSGCITTVRLLGLCGRKSIKYIAKATTGSCIALSELSSRSITCQGI